MSYQVIARKWRPQTFEEVTGQEAVTRTLRNALQHDRLHHAYLFSGARGVGKTTTARLLAKALNCHKTDKPNPIPCSPNDKDACPSCIEIAEGRSIDVLEIDAASNTGIDDVRDRIIENININPARDRYKVFIIDEVHQLSKPAFNALLKTLEEPPPKVVFIMATTELHKVPDTILSRCQEFEFKTIAVNKIFDSLKKIAAAEKVTITDPALKEVARAGEGSMRDAQSAFDQVISFSGEKIEVEDVVNALGIAGVDILLRAIKGIGEHNTLEAFEIVEELNRRGHDLRSFCRDLLSFFRDLLVAKVAGNSEGLLDWAAVSREDLRAQAEQFSEADLLRFFSSLADTETQLRTATQPRFILEIGLVKLMEMRRVASLEKILERLAALESGAPAPTEDNTKMSASAATASPTSSPAAPEEKKTKFLDNLLEESPVVVQQTEESPQTPPEVDDVPFETASPVKAAAKAPVYEAPRAAYAYAPATVAAQLAPEDITHFEDTRLDNAFEEALRRDGDDILDSTELDLSSFSAEQRFAPPPPRQPVPAIPAIPAAPAAPPVQTTPVNGTPKPATGANGAQTIVTSAKKPAPPASVAKLASKLKAELNKNGKPWLAKAFDEVSRIDVTESELIIFLPEAASYWDAVLQAPENTEIIASLAGQALEKSLTLQVQIEGRDVALKVPNTAELEKARESAPELWQAAQEDQAIKQVLNVFRGVIIDVHKTAAE
jgi:DNA polymerase III subunit gamma/tau